MNFKESEASTVRCPFFREVGNIEAVKNLKELPIHVHAMCMGSACKAGWNWSKNLVGRESKTEGYCGFNNTIR